MVAHKDLTGLNLHEPKGVATATNGAVYIADGAGSGTWTVLNIPDGTFRTELARFTSNGTWTKPVGTFFIKVHLQGGGQGCSTNPGSAGNGATSSFGAYVSATGGGATVGVTGDINLDIKGTKIFTNMALTFPSTITGNWMWSVMTNVPYAEANGAMLGQNSSISPSNFYGGYPGNIAIKHLAGNAVTNTVSVTVGSGGGAGTGGADGLSGSAIIESFILL